MELIQVKGNTWCLKAAELIPVYRLDARRCILLDSGWNWEREALREVLEQKGLTPVGVIGTHSHVDHAGNHGWLRETYGAKVCMPAQEAVISANPAMYKMMYSSMSMGTMMNIFNHMIFQTDQPIGPEDGEIEFAGAHFHIYHTPGHTVDHICVGTPDGICYVGDLLMAGKARRNAQLPYHFIHRMARASMEKMRNIPGYSGYIVAHRKILEELGPAVDANLAMLDYVSEQILDLMKEPVTWEELIKQVLEHNQLFTKEEAKSVLYERAVESFVDDLKDTGRLTVEVKQGIRRYKRN